jgi:hypothetical protein
MQKSWPNSVALLNPRNPVRLEDVFGVVGEFRFELAASESSSGVGVAAKATIQKQGAASHSPAPSLRFTG